MAMDEVTMMVLKTLQEIQRDLGSINAKNDAIDTNVNSLRENINVVDRDLDTVRTDVASLKANVRSLIDHYQAKEGKVDLNIHGNVDGSVNTGKVDGSVG